MEMVGSGLGRGARAASGRLARLRDTPKRWMCVYVRASSAACSVGDKKEVVALVSREARRRWHEMFQTRTSASFFKLNKSETKLDQGQRREVDPHDLSSNFH
jgi:hypothetical protein